MEGMGNREWGTGWQRRLASSARRGFTLASCLVSLALSSCASLDLAEPLRPVTDTAAPVPPVRIVWRRDVNGGFGPTPPLVAGDVLLVGTRRGDVVAVDRESGRIVAREEIGSAVEGALALSADGRVLYATTHGGGAGVRAHDLVEGRERWRWPRRDTPRAVRREGAVAGGVVRIGDVVVASTLRGVTVGLDADTGAERWRREALDTLSQVRTAPVPLPGGMVFIADTGGDLAALDAATGAVRWTARAPGPVYAMPAVADGTVVVTTTRGGVAALDAVTGAVRWRADLGAGVRLSPPALGPGVAVVGSSDGSVRALDLTTGDARWTWAADGAVSVAPLVAGDVVWIGTLTRRVVALDAATGAERFATTLGGRVRGGLAAAGGTLFVLTEPRHVVALRP